MPDPIPVYIHLLRAKDLIDREYAQHLDVPALARAAHASTAHFSRSFKKAFGETPHQYLLRRRIERAKDLLRGTGLSVTEVSPGRLPKPRLLQHRVPRPRRRPAERLRASLAIGRRSADPGLLHAHVHTARASSSFREARTSAPD